MIEGRHGGSGAACGPRPKLPHFIYFTQTDWLWVRPRLSLHYSTPPPITQYTLHIQYHQKLPFDSETECRIFLFHMRMYVHCTVYSIKWTQWQSADRQRLSRGDFFLSDPGLKPIYHTEKSHLRPVGSRSDAPRKSPLGNTIVLLPAWFFQPIIIIFT